MEAQQGLKGVSESELPIENSDGWRFDWLGMVSSILARMEGQLRRQEEEMP
jgi:hypothetical protein